ncbi:MAG: amidohydrolase family protein [Firmicutes bacterium]|nr:amidohydrolase family protein [Bacillota bacterium]
MYDLLIKNAFLYEIGKHKDLGIKNGKIVEIGEGIPETSGLEVIQANGNLVAPGFVDSHMHLDKVFSLGTTESKTLASAIVEFTNYCNSIKKEDWKQDVKRRAKEVARMVVKSGTTTLRTHINIEASTDLYSVEAINELKNELKDFVDIKITSLTSFYDGPEAIDKRLDLLDYACKNGLIDFVGGSPHAHDNWEELTDKLFTIAVRNNLPIDFHVNESDNPDIRNFEQIADLTMKYGYEGLVSCGHVTALNAVDDQTAARVIAKAKKADLQIITLPSCNLYLMGRNDKQPIRRGVTRIREFLEAGVNISYASDNICDPFRPFGNGDMLEEGLLTAQVAQMATKSELETVFRMGTINPAKTLLLKDYGLGIGKQADLVIFDTDSVAEALIRQATRSYVIKKGKIVARNTKISEIIF